MIVLDTSAIFAVLAEEPEAPMLNEVMSREVSFCLSAPTWVEAVMVCQSRLENGRARLEELAGLLRLDMRSFDSHQAEIAAEAFARFGRGSKSRARLNLGDCFSYALARALDAPLLFKGDDFAHTDIRSALDAAL